MADLMAGHWILVSDGSIAKLATFFRGCREQGVETPGLVVAPPNHRKALQAAKLDWPANWSLYTAGPLWGERDQWFGILWDDQCPEVPRWDSSMVSQVVSWRVVTSLEPMYGDWCSGSICWGMDALNAGGGLNFTKLHQSLRQWCANAMASNIWLIDRSVQMPRRIFGIGSKLSAVTPQPDVVAHLQGLMHDAGARVINPDWTGMKLQISTPSMASRPEALYMIALMGMLAELKSRGVGYQLGFERYNADISLARSHIISEFLRTDCTHLLMIDDDMTWDFNALERLVYAKKDFVAVAGPKKRYPLVFAASLVDDEGRAVPMQMEEGSGTAQVTSVGAAFVLISRQCAEKMRDAHPELEYVAGDGKTCWGLFLPMIDRKTYKPEDFSFCERWRRIGGKVYICPDVPLGHIGAHEFRGDLLSNAVRGT